MFEIMKTYGDSFKLDNMKLPEAQIEVLYSYFFYN